MGDRYDDWVSILPAHGTAAETAQLLLGLAEDPADVRTIRGGAEFLVAPHVGDLYEKALAPKPRRRTKKEDTNDGS
ncbi:hypothetical protein [Streptomyces sp. NPDC048338]|jgi:hypothetical protein|uniref:hypothetical protein n=1 Tax=Streptomyces sp. NPDC048338 TaxID=3365536 RepID=UPI003712E9CD